MARKRLSLLGRCLSQSFGELEEEQGRGKPCDTFLYLEGQRAMDADHLSDNMQNSGNTGDHLYLVLVQIKNIKILFKYNGRVLKT